MPLPGDGPVRLRLSVWRGILRFWYAVGVGPWTHLGVVLDAGRLSDEHTDGGPWNFTGGWVSLSCHDLSGRGMPARFTRLTYQELTAAP
jgi:xylan 1,4-beta-xylosidase